MKYNNNDSTETAVCCIYGKQAMLINQFNKCVEIKSSSSSTFSGLFFEKKCLSFFSSPIFSSSRNIYIFRSNSKANFGDSKNLDGEKNRRFFSVTD